MTTTATQTSTAYDQLIAIARDAQLLRASLELLSWDQEVLMPPGGLAYRSRQLAQLARVHHETFTDPKVGNLLDECEGNDALMSDPLSPGAVNVREIRHDYDRQVRLPAALVTEEAELASIG